MPKATFAEKSPRPATVQAGRLVPGREHPASGAGEFRGQTPAAQQRGTVPTLEARVEQLTHRVEALLTIVGPIVTRRVSVERQAKIAGVSRTTLWRRRRRAAGQLALQTR